MPPKDEPPTTQRTSDLINDLNQTESDLLRGDAKTTPPKIFLSFASEDAWWIEWFTKEKWFGQQIGNVDIVDYSAGDNLDFGPLGSWVDQCIHQATVVIAFISEFYRKKKWTEVEWKKALTEVQRGRLIFVPIMMDADAKGWWEDLRERGDLRALPDDYMYSDFTVRGKRVKIAQDDAVQEKIAQSRPKQLKVSCSHRLLHNLLPSRLLDLRPRSLLSSVTRPIGLPAMWQNVHANW